MALYPIWCTRHELEGEFSIAVLRNHDREHAAEDAAMALLDQERRKEAAKKKADRASKKARRDNKNAKKKSQGNKSAVYPSRYYSLELSDKKYAGRLLEHGIRTMDHCVLASSDLHNRSLSLCLFRPS